MTTAWTYGRVASAAACTSGVTADTPAPRAITVRSICLVDLPSTNRDARGARLRVALRAWARKAT